MTDKRVTPDPDDLLQHYRQHSAGEPPAALDAFILNTARREAPAPQMSVWQRWRNICKQPRWQMAFATVAGLALMVGVVMREPVAHNEISTATFSVQAPMARIAMAPKDERAGAMVGQSAAERITKRAPVPGPALEEGLREIVALREAGASRAADEKLLALHERFPQEDLPGLLEGVRRR